jgi:hypothetical protein
LEKINNMERARLVAEATRKDLLAQHEILSAIESQLVSSSSSSSNEAAGAGQWRDDLAQLFGQMSRTSNAAASRLNLFVASELPSQHGSGVIAPTASSASSLSRLRASQSLDSLAGGGTNSTATPARNSSDINGALAIVQQPPEVVFLNYCVTPAPRVHVTLPARAAGQRRWLARARLVHSNALKEVCVGPWEGAPPALRGDVTLAPTTADCVLTFERLFVGQPALKLDAQRFRLLFELVAVSATAAATAATAPSIEIVAASAASALLELTSRAPNADRGLVPAPVLTTPQQSTMPYVSPQRRQQADRKRPCPDSAAMMLPPPPSGTQIASLYQPAPAQQLASNVTVRKSASMPSRHRKSARRGGTDAAAASSSSNTDYAYVDITDLLVLPQKEAARRLGISESMLCKRFKERTRRKWPYRYLRKIDKVIDMLGMHKEAGNLSPSDNDKLERLKRERVECLKSVMIRITAFDKLGNARDGVRRRVQRNAPSSPPSSGSAPTTTITRAPVAASGAMVSPVQGDIETDVLLALGQMKNGSSSSQQQRQQQQRLQQQQLLLQQRQMQQMRQYQQQQLGGGFYAPQQQSSSFQPAPFVPLSIASSPQQQQQHQEQQHQHTHLTSLPPDLRNPTFRSITVRPSASAPAVMADDDKANWFSQFHAPLAQPTPFAIPSSLSAMPLGTPTTTTTTTTTSSSSTTN